MPDRLRMLFVCTGNICRSPMAEGIARHLAESRYRLSAGRIGASSAGIAGLDGDPPTGDAITALRTRGIDISAHRARSLTEEILRESDLVLAMEEHHLHGVNRLLPRARAYLLLKMGEAARGAVNAGKGTWEEDPPFGRLGALESIYRVTERNAAWEHRPEYYFVEDPLGMGLSAYSSAADRLCASVEPILDVLIGRA